MVSMMNSWGLSMKLLLVSAGLLSVAVGFRFSVPIAASGVPTAWSFVVSWFKPPYLYLIINGIIITIFASSRFHESGSEQHALRSELLVPVETPPIERFEPFSAQPEISADVAEEPLAAEVVVSAIEDVIVELRPVVVNGLKVDHDIESEVETVVHEEAREVDEFEDMNTPPAPEEMVSLEVQLESLFPVREKPLVGSRFGHRKANRSTPEGAKTLRVARAKKHETLESTWKMITEGRHVPLTRHLKKTDTWEQDHVAAVPKSETFKDRGGNYAPPMPGRIGKEPSLGQDELNRRVEAFIKKFNEEMRIQRRESMMNQYGEQMIKQ